jgi:dolichyl-phosphate-mannose--protein O-mannosyl transferase
MVFSIRSRKVPEKTDDPFIVNTDIDEQCEKKGNVYRQEPAWISRFHDHIRLALLTFTSLYLRITQLGYPAFVTESELEITRQVNWYMAGKFFIGKFPPLTGILASGLARIVGYYGTEDLTYPGQ